jgi:YVTN family beta-propeller protein
LVIDTATNTVVATVPVGNEPSGVAITPDGKHAYVTNLDEALPAGSVSVIDTTTNTVAATVLVGTYPVCVGIIPPPPGVPFLAFSAKLEIDLDKKPIHEAFQLQASFTLGSASNGINPAKDPVTLKIGTFAVTIPPGSFTGKGFGPFYFAGVIDRVPLHAVIAPTGAKRYAFDTAAQNANLKGTKNPVMVMLTIGDDSGTTSVKADIDH